MSEQQQGAFEQWCPDLTCYARVAVAGPTLGWQIEPSMRNLTGSQLAERLMACNDVAYLRGRVQMRAAFEKDPGRRSLEGMETQADLNAALRRLERYRPKDQR
ncbi:hypothetical protein [Mycobacteroides abscessus]|nr:hypothetical protein [Mycobacteroides abscessus]MDO3042128.1 hypothetical protein [Mycobacteroides abscessus subsp. abscessus]MDO3111620.1 hypothetical protein [Mycobacteroides abscessus subsp. massiliense]SIH66005.1 Uncharacterised protein [Mycobacteroides abscessus subsp. abscessus]